MLVAMTENKKNQNKENKNINRKIKMDGIIVAELEFKKTKYLLVKVLIPKNDYHWAILTEYNDGNNDILTIKAVGIYPEDTFFNAIQKANETGADEEVDRYYLLLGKFVLSRWNGGD